MKISSIQGKGPQTLLSGGYACFSFGAPTSRFAPTVVSHSVDLYLDRTIRTKSVQWFRTYTNRVCFLCLKQSFRTWVLIVTWFWYVYKSHQTRHERLNFGSGYLWRGCVSKFLFTFLPFSVCVLHRSKTPNLHLTLKKSCRNPLSQIISINPIHCDTSVRKQALVSYSELIVFRYVAVVALTHNDDVQNRFDERFREKNKSARDNFER